MKELSLEIARKIYEKYKFIKEISIQNTNFALRALSRGFPPEMIEYGLEQVIKKIIFQHCIVVIT